MPNLLLRLPLILIATAFLTVSFGVSEAVAKSKRYDAYIACVHKVAWPQVQKKQAISRAINTGISSCKRPFNSYVSELLNKTMRKHGWSSLDRSVKPAAEKNVIQTTHNVLTKIYRRK